MTVSSVHAAASGSMMSGASAMAPPQQKMSNLFSQIDSSNSGTITQDQFNQAFQTLNPPDAFTSAGADAVWNKLDPSGSGQVSQSDFVNGMKSLMVQLRQPGADTGAQTAAAATQSLNTLGGSVNILV